MLKMWEKHPQRFGIVWGFVLMPLLWLFHEKLLHSAFGLRSSSGYELANYYVAGAIPGMLAGVGLSKAALAAQKGYLADVKRHLLVFGGGVWTFSAFLITLTSRFGLPVDIAVNFPLHCAHLMLFIGLLMRSRR